MDCSIKYLKIHGQIVEIWPFQYAVLIQEYSNMLSAFWLLAAFVHRVSVSLIYFVVQCEDSRCHVWQHIGCVIIAEKPMEGVLPASPAIFYCELCRLTRADPYVIPVIFSPFDTIWIVFAEVLWSIFFL